ncbi:hypothetical protein ACFO0N_00330 [Halobium salinum]|uniref:Uncharacterized protein n=1 Tax=Halobium salinum TaxID=1364940 RepID=A0ABD5P7C4_9EURY|nr:hypothetical protein [Halobium salinum]
MSEHHGGPGHGDEGDFGPADAGTAGTDVDDDQLRPVFAEFTDQHGSIAVIDVPSEREMWLLSSCYVPVER